MSNEVGVRAVFVHRSSRQLAFAHVHLLAVVVEANAHVQNLGAFKFGLSSRVHGVEDVDGGVGVRRASVVRCVHRHFIVGRRRGIV